MFCAKKQALRHNGRAQDGSIAVLFQIAPAAFQRQADVNRVEILRIKLILHHLNALGKALVVDDLPLPQIAQHVDHIRVIRLVEQIFIGCTSLLLWYDLISTT